MVESDNFISSHMFVSLYSQQGCTVSVSCQFPSEEDRGGGKKGASMACSQKVFRKLVQAEVREKVEELAGDRPAQRLYEQEMRRLQEGLLRMRRGQWFTNEDFVAINIDKVDYVETKRHLLALQARIDEERAAMAQLKREALERHRVQRTQFNMVKWELYRQKCEHLEDKYADFKRLQKKINWFVCLATRAKMVRVLKRNFDAHKAEVLLQLRKEEVAARFQRYFFKVYLHKVAPDAKRRTKQWLRQSLTAGTQGLKGQAQAVGAVKMRSFLYDTMGIYNFRVAARRFNEAARAVGAALRSALRAREEKVRRLEELFDLEKRAMINHFTKSKKAKKGTLGQKLLFNLQNLGKLDPDGRAKSLVLGTYYQWVLVQENLIEAIYYHAAVKMARGGDDQDPLTLSGQLTELEHRNVIKLTRNLKLAKDFLFGTKKAVEPAVGVRPVAGEAGAAAASEEKKSAKATRGASFMQLLNEASLQDDGEADGGKAEGTDQGGAAEESKEGRQPVHAPGSAQKSASKAAAPKKEKSSNSRTRAGAATAGKKGGKKKKAKEGEIVVDTAIPVPARRPVYATMPDRDHLQALVRKAVDIAKKKSDAPPAFEEVRPWIRVQNLDVLV